MTEFLPRASAPAVDSSGRFTRETYDALRRTIAALNDADIALSERQRETLAILNALGADDVESLEALGPLLDGKQDASEVLDAVSAIIGTGIVAYKPGAAIGRTIAPVAGETTVANGSGLAGNPTVGLADVANSGAGSLLAITRDTKGRVSGTKAATITGTAGRVTVANGDAGAGLPTVDLATVADGGGGALLRIVRDAWGRITGTSTPTTTDLAEGSNLYFTAQRVRDTVLTGLSTATNAVITATDTVLSALGKLQAQISGLIVQTITDGDTTHAPSGDAVFDALALKTDNASAAITGGTINGATVGATTAASGKFTDLISQNALVTSTHARFQGGDLSPAGAAGVGFEAYSDGTNAVIQAFNRTSIGFVPLKLGASYSFFGGSDIRPESDNTLNCGIAANRWKEIFAGNATINTSDARDKTAPRDLTPAELAAAADIARLPSIFQWLHAIEEKGDDARMHCSPTVQAVIGVMEKHGLDPFRYAFICYDKWDETPEVRGEEGEVTQEYRPAGDRYSLRPSELAHFVMRGQEARIAALEKLTEKLTVQ